MPTRSVAPLLLASALLLAACAPASRFPATGSVAAPVTAQALDTGAAARPRPYPLVEPPAFARAVARGTRTRSGAPGPRYWQQFARYALEATWRPDSSRVLGRGTARYFNRSPDTLRHVFVQLNQNLFAPDAIRNEPVPVTKGMELARVVAQGRTLTDSAAPAASAAPRYEVEGTVMRIVLPRPLLPGDSADFAFEWAFTLPPDGAPRSGNTGENAFVAYWYPHFAVYDDVNGWHTDPYMGTAEFHHGFADYDVRITVPAGWLVGASGRLVNAGEVLAAQTRERLARARRTGEIVRVVTEADRGPGRATLAPAGGTLTWRFEARGVRDVAFGLSDRFLWDATHALVRDGARTDTVDIFAFYRPKVAAWAWDQGARYLRHSIEFLSRYLWPYPWPVMTMADGPVSCSGMEYPMITCIGGRRDTLSLYSVTVHETAHMWFPMQASSDERRHAWQDEGLTRFNQAQAMREFFGGYDLERIARDQYLALARAGGEVELMRHGDLYPVGTPAYGIASYAKMATNWAALRALLGDSLFHDAYREYGRRWIGKHPTPTDLFNAIEDVAGRDLDWFWRSWWFETWTLDHAVAEARVVDGALEVTVEDRGLAPMPARLTVTREGGRTELVEVPVETWLRGARRAVVRVPDGRSVRSVVVDAGQRFPDIDRRNDAWTAPGAPGVSGTSPARP